VAFFGTMEGLYQCEDPLVRKFVEYDSATFQTAAPGR